MAVVPGFEVYWVDSTRSSVAKSRQFELGVVTAVRWPKDFSSGVLHGEISVRWMFAFGIEDELSWERI